MPGVGGEVGEGGKNSQSREGIRIAHTFLKLPSENHKLGSLVATRKKGKTEAGESWGEKNNVVHSGERNGELKKGIHYVAGWADEE